MKKFIFVLLIGLFMVGFGSAALTNTTMLSDDFENVNFNLWTDNGVTDWSLATNQANSPTHSALAEKTDNDLYSDDLDMSDAVAIYISFSYPKSS
jgi:hypothetical protein